MSETKDGGPAFPVWELNGNGQPEMTGFGMTLRQYAAIHLRVPNSGTDWLDEMIRERQRDDIAIAVMQATATKVAQPTSLLQIIRRLLGKSSAFSGADGPSLAAHGYRVADDALAEREKRK